MSGSENEAPPVKDGMKVVALREPPVKPSSPDRRQAGPAESENFQSPVEEAAD